MSKTEYFEGSIGVWFQSTRVTHRFYATVEEAVADLRKRGYTVVSGGGLYTIGISTRLHNANGKGSFARSITSASPNAWVTVVAQIRDWNQA